MIVLSSYIYPENVEPKRLIDFAHEVLSTIPTKNGAKKACKRGQILVEGQVVEPGRYVVTGQKIEHVDHENEKKSVFELVLDIIYEDEYLAIINKPAGYSVSGNYFRTIENAIPFNVKPSIKNDALKYAKPVHRLDNQTSGLLLIAKTDTARVNLGKQFEQKFIKKQYQAVIIDTPVKKCGVIGFPIEGKKAFTKYEIIDTVSSLKYSKLSLVNLFPETGRTHQLRIHLSKMGHPILGDKIYTPEGLLFKGKGLFLSAVGLFFMHPVLNKQMEFMIDTPKKITALLNREQARWNKVNSQGNFYRIL